VFVRKFFVFLVLGLIPFVSSPAVALDARFVDVQKTIPGVKTEIRYFGTHNFIGKRIRGYAAPKCLLTREAAAALAKVQNELQKKSLSLRIYDCYRPQRAVDHFVAWAKNLRDVKMKEEFYPHVEKTDLFAGGYIAAKSGHSRGSTLDVTIDGLDMGSPYDFFDPISHTESPRIYGQSRQNRRFLKRLMARHGFRNLPEEWWHYTLQNEPFPEKYFDFVVK
jgi:D-alanyl-D-alanine dipeptidase